MLFRSHGKERITGVTIAKVDEKRRPLPETGEYIPCDTLLLSVGLIPENELSLQAGLRMDPATGGAIADQDRQTEIPGIFSCGNVLHVHDLVDFVSREAEIAGKSAAAYINGQLTPECSIPVSTDGKIRYTVPQKLTRREDTTLYFRVSNRYNNVEIRIVGEMNASVSRINDLSRETELFQEAAAFRKVLHSVKKRKAAPGEMETIRIKKELLSGVSELKLELEELPE